MKAFIAFPVIVLLILRMFNSVHAVRAESLYAEGLQPDGSTKLAAEDPDPLGRRRLLTELIDKRREQVTKQYWTERFNRENREYLSRLFNYPDAVTYRQYCRFLETTRLKGIDLEQVPDDGVLDYIRDEILRKKIINGQIRGTYLTRAEYEENKSLFGTFSDQQHYVFTAYNLEYRVKRYVRECIKLYYHDNEEFMKELLSVLNNDICDTIERHVKFGLMGNGKNRVSVLLSELGYGVFILNDRLVLVIPPECQVITSSLLSRKSLESFPKGSPLAAFISSLRNNCLAVRNEIRELFIHRRSRQEEKPLGQREIAIAGGLEFLKDLYGLGGTN